mgnify:CR=1 FL=1
MPDIAIRSTFITGFPNESQQAFDNLVEFLKKYEYYGTDHTEVYWVHFTGRDVKTLLRSYGIKDDIHVIDCGSNLDYQQLFRSMIQEIQMQKEDYAEMTELYLRQILISLHRYLSHTNKIDNSQMVEEIDKAIDRKEILSSYADTVKLRYNAVSRMITVRKQVEDELKML